MSKTFELRWFWRASAARDPIVAWFSRAHARSAPSIEERTDVYAPPSSAALGIKQRGERAGLEIKLRSGVLARVDAGPLSGRPEVWTKLLAPQSVTLDEEAGIVLHKRRATRCFVMSEEALHEVATRPRMDGARCAVEVATLTFARGDQRWCTLCFEASGKRGEAVLLLQTALRHFVDGAPDALGAMQAASYPEWLAEHAPAR